jgi:hypothetical protein
MMRTAALMANAKPGPDILFVTQHVERPHWESTRGSRRATQSLSKVENVVQLRAAMKAEC